MQNEGKHFNHFMEQVILIFIFIETKISLCVFIDCNNDVCFKFKQNRSNLSYSCSIYAPSRTSIYQGNVKLHFNNLYMI